MTRSALKYVPQEGGTTGAELDASQSIFEYLPGESPAVALQNMIYHRFAEMDVLASPSAVELAAETRLEAMIQFASRWGGIGLFVAAFSWVVVAMI